MKRRGLILLIGLPLMMGSVAAEKMSISRGVDGSLAQESGGSEYEEESEQQESESGIPIGSFRASFSGFDMRERAVWLGDFRYELYPGYKVIGKNSKRGTLASIPLDEMVFVVVKENKNKSMTPYLVEIRHGGN